jgi:hypothetical protein
MFSRAAARQPPCSSAELPPNVLRRARVMPHRWLAIDHSAQSEKTSGAARYAMGFDGRR